MSELKYLLMDVQRRYPEACLSDYIKLIYQNEFGCGHYLFDERAAKVRLTQECEGAKKGQQLLEPVGNGYYRLHLKNAVDLGLSMNTIHRIFLLSSQGKRGRKESYQRKLNELLSLCKERLLPFSEGSCFLYLVNYEAAGMPAIHHSAIFKQMYAPSYRIISRDFGQFIELFIHIDKLLATGRTPVIVGIDGACASGKSTLAERIGMCYDCNIFHTDDFYLQPHQKTAERQREVGGNMDRERFCAEVLEPISRGGTVYYRPYSCQTQRVSPGIRIPFQRLNIVEGSYCLHPDLRQYYHLKTVLLISGEHQISRLKRRVSQKDLKHYLECWIPKESEYRNETNLTDCADLIFSC